MARQKSDILSGMGSGYEIVKAIADEVKNLGGGDDDLRRILSEPSLRLTLGKAIMHNGSEVSPSNATTYPVTIDYADTFEQRLASGRYDWKNSDINKKNFPVKGEGTVDRILELAHYAKDMSTDAVLAAIDAQGYRPATIEDLLAFGAKYPELQREFPIVALGSVWQNWFGNRYVAYLYRVGDKRNLDLYWFVHDWRALYRFLVVRKSA